ncbi:TetR family transcriptional regulator [Kineothrix alysoides]|uniref:TetR family transcriptional regulator n=1 Tax=Kineothrix alysoides TaxID=1469948 RepID=A0A4R1QXX1_9FIRM|nr:TetR/AcrR family transcriptional regulator [Kineothrix alysoides]TCL57204.1 TetR family transcriptional regulator [Kineothrix alysoides]
MPKDKSGTLEKIIPCAKREFLDKGFERASLRKIAADANMSAAGLYRHFESKEAMFDALVAPLVDIYLRNYEESMQRSYELLDTEEIKKFWEVSEEEGLQYINFIYDHFEEFKLLLTCSDGTKYQSFMHDISEMEVREMTKLMDELRSRGFSVKDISQDELHMLVSGYVASVFEVVIHDYPREKAIAQAKTLMEFLYPGWIKAFGMEGMV